MQCFKGFRVGKFPDPEMLKVLCAKCLGVLSVGVLSLGVLSVGVLSVGV